MNIPPQFAAESALLRQNVSLSVIKQSAEQDQAIANLVADAARSAPISGARGTNVNISA